MKQNEDAEETNSHVNDNSIFYFDCQICQNTVSACKGQENMDPNSEPEICRNCKASQNVQNTDDTNNLILRAPNSKTSQPVAAAVPQEEFDAVNISPLTSTISPLTTSSELAAASASQADHQQISDHLFLLEILTLLQYLSNLRRLHLTVFELPRDALVRVPWCL